MKRITLTIVLALVLGLGITSLAYSADGDIAQAEVRADVDSYKMAHVLFNIASQQCIVRYDRYAGTENIGKEIKVIFQNISDDIGTEADETSNEFNQLVTLINNGSNIKSSITQACKIKLGIE